MQQGIENLVFLSHAEEDSDLTERVFDALNRMNLNPYDYKHVFGGVGVRISDTILEKIRECKCFIVFLTENGVKSQWVNQEIGMAYALDKHVIPIVQENINYEGVLVGRKHINYDPYDKDKCIFEIILQFRSTELSHIDYRLSNINEVKVECPYCHTEQTCKLPDLQKHKKIIEQNCLMEYTCNNCKEEFYLEPKTLKPRCCL